MAKYNYLDAMVEDIKDYINYDVDYSDYTDLDDFRDTLYDDLWTVDGVTGNGSGSYTFNAYKAKEYVVDNIDLVGEMIREFDIDAKTVGEKFINEDWEYFDVSIRCYLLGQALDKAIEELGITDETFETEEDEDEEDEDEE